MPTKKAIRSDQRYEVSITLGRNENGKRIRKSFYGKTQKEAKNKRDEFVKRMNEGLEKPDDSLHSWIVQWARTSSTSPAMRKANEMYANKLDAAMGERPISSIRMIDLMEFAQSMAHYSYSTVKSLQRVTNRIFKDAVRNRVINYNPADGVRWDYAFKGTHRALEGWEKALIAENHQAHRAGIWAMLMLFGGLRRGEALALEWEDIDLENNVIHITKAIHFESNAAVVSTTKTEAGVRDVPLLPQLKAALTAYEPRTGRICLSASGNPVATEAAFRRGWQSYLNEMENILNGQPAFKPGRRTDLHDESWKTFSVRTHDLRHTFCTMLYNAGIGLKEAQYIMGHADVSMTLEVYTHLDNERKRTATNMLTNYHDDFK